MTTLRIFISSPGDVAAERDKARLVIAQLQQLYGDRLQLVPVLWEDLPLRADASFQDGIDLVLSAEHGIDVAVFILWSRLGSPVGGASRRPDGTAYRSGTEREFDLMLAALARTESLRPHVLAYVRADDTGFKQRLTTAERSDDWEQLIVQRKLVESFIRERFHDERGLNLRAYHTYGEPVSFASRLKVHLREVIDQRLGETVPEHPLWAEPPYRGLEVFDFQHAAIFQGRQQETCDVELLLRRRMAEDQCAFAVIVGASGSGKSSLARAGVAASLVRYNLDDSVRAWRYAVFSPGAAGGQWLVGLVRTLVEPLALPELHASGVPLEDLAADLATNPGLTIRQTLRPAFTRAEQREGGKVRMLLVLDQMEELWTDPRCTAQERETLLAAIEALAESGQVWVLATLRSDFYPQAQESDVLLRLKGANGQYDLRPPGPAALTRVIAEPARLAGLSFECNVETGRSLDHQILEDALRQPEALPLLQYVLRELYEGCNGGSVLSFAAYDELGGVEGALGRRAEAVFLELPDDARAAFGAVFNVLVTVDAFGEGAGLRRRAPLASLTAEPARRILVDALIAHRFLTADRAGDLAVAALTHEALLRRWERLAAWVAANREHLRLRARIEQAQGRWEQEQNDPSLLLPAGLPLAEGRSLLLAAPHLLSSETTQFIRASIASHESAQSRRARVRRTVISALSMLVVLISVLAAAAIMQRRNTIAVEREKAKTEAALVEVKEQNRLADHYRGKAERLNAVLTFQKGTALCNEGDAGRGMLWMARSLEICPESALALQRSIRTALPSEAATVHTLEAVFAFPNQNVITSISPDGKTLLVGGQDARLVDVATEQIKGKPQSSASVISSVAFSPDGKLFASSTTKGVVRVASTTSGEDVGPAITHNGSVRWISFSPDGKTLLVAARFALERNGIPLQCFDVATRRPVPGLTFDCQDDLYMATYSPDATLVATAAMDKNASLWDAKTGRRIASPLLHPGVVFAVAFSPDGRTLATGCLDGGVRFWRVATGEQAGPILHHKGPVRSLAFSRDGRLILTGSEDGTARLWEAGTGRPVGQILSHPSEVRHVLFTPDQAHILTAGIEGTTRLWRMPTEGSLAKVLTHPAAVAAIAFSPDGKRAITGCQDSTERPGESRLWDPETGTPLGPPRSQGQIMAVAFSPDGKLAVTTGGDRTARVWNTSDGSPAQPPWPYGKNAATAAFSPDGRLVAIGGQGAIVQLREVATGKMIASWEAYDRQVYWTWSLAFTPDSRRLLTGGGFSGQLWSIPDAHSVGQPMQHAFDVRLALLSPDGQTVLTCSQDKTARLWSGIDGHPLSPPLIHMGEIRSGAFRPDSKVVATASADGTVRLWDVPTGRSLMPPLFHDGWVRSVAFSPDGKALVTGCDDGTARLWSADDGAPLGAVLRHRGPVNRVAYSPNGKTVLTASSDGTARLWTPPMPVVGEPVHVALWVQVLTGMELDAEGTVQVLPADTWQQRRRQLDEQKGQALLSAISQVGTAHNQKKADTP